MLRSHIITAPLVIAFLGAAGCSQKPPITTFAGYCNFLQTDGQSEWWERLVDAHDALACNCDSVRVSVAAVWDSIVTTEGARMYVDNAPVDSPAIRELRRLRMMGAWSEGTHLHIANTLITSTTALGVDESSQRQLDVDTFNQWVTGARDAIREDKSCLAYAVNLFFDDVTFHGPHSTVIVVAVSHFYTTDPKVCRP